MQCRCARAHGKRIRSVDELRKVLLKARYLRPSCNPVRAQSVDDFVDFLLSDQRRRERQ